ncbi:glycosyltransferase [Parachaetomium inaequale]|uniref:Glycosyltransferase n=1 Tax=Parachaetomium inaequale TaxID=2588326 RepID=A0AAN6SQ60_9PEZI|nr:glycosyltransferase [Parachaetomium inaequale]
MSAPRCTSSSRTWANTFTTATVDPVVGAAGAAGLCAVGVHWLSSSSAGGVSQSAEVGSEVVCWGVLPFLVAGVRRWGGAHQDRARGERGGSGSGLEAGVGLLGGDGGGGKAASSWSVGVVAVGVVVAACYTAEVGEVGLFPVLTPLLLVADRKLRSEAQRSEPGIAALANTVWGTASVALVACLALLSWSLLELALLTVPVAALLVVYIALIPRAVAGPRLLPLVPDLEDAILSLSGKVVVLLVGVLARHTSWCTATAIGTFGLVASRDPFIQLSELEALSPVIASLLALAQLIFMLPKQAKGRLALWALFLVSLGPYLANIVAIRTAQSSALHSQEHPAELLIRSAKADFERLLERQSKTYTAAVEEYQRRYGVAPPPGFKEWYEFAVANQSPIIDEFDIIYGSVSPFWKLSGKEVVQIMNDAHQTPSIDLWLCSFSGATAETHCSHPARGSDRHTGDMFNKLLGDLRGVLPDTKFLVNHLDEPRVLIPPSSSPDKTPFTLTDLSERPTWDAVTKFCASQPHPRRPNPLETVGLPLVTDLNATLNLCIRPEYASTHGLFQAPPSFRIIEGLVPVLSTGAPSTMSDILFPSPAYIVEPQFRYNPAVDPPWPDKSNHLYWTGSTTGAVASEGSNNWRAFHRQRFLALAQNLPPRQQHTYLREDPSSPGRVTTAQSGFLNGRWYKVFPTRIFQCSPPGGAACRQQRAYFRSLPWQDGDAALGAKLVFDLDGNGISGRFYKLLASRSLVMKQTLLREWHDERLVPWAHYVPVSVGMGEVPEVVGWFLGTGRGMEMAREVADGGAEWFGMGMREVDVKIYMWRLVLELARVGDAGRGVLKG